MIFALLLLSMSEKIFLSPLLFLYYQLIQGLDFYIYMEDITKLKRDYNFKSSYDFADLKLLVIC